MLNGGWRHTVVGVFLCLATLSFAQENSGRIEGRIENEGKGITAVVVLINELKVSAVSDGEGRFEFDAIPPGTYTLIFTLGNNTLAQPNVVVTGVQPHVMTVEVDWDMVSETIRVTAAARAAKIVDAPAAVTSIPEAQIEKQASHGQVPKILEFTPGAEVTQSGLYDFNFNTRGFNSSLNRRVSTYIDGRDVGVVLLGAQEWAAIAGGLDDVASLEFIRGPSAALYGANASSGVVNITTKAPRDSPGTLVRVTGGGLETQSVDFRRSAPVHGGWYSKVVAGLKNSGDFSVSRNPDGPDQLTATMDDLMFPEYSRIERAGMETPFCRNPTVGGPGPTLGQPECLPQERTLAREQDNEIRYGSVRFDRYFGSDDSILTFEAGVSVIKGPVFQTGIGRVQILGASRPFYRAAWSNDRWSVLVHHSEREGNQINLNNALKQDFKLITDTSRTGVEGQGNWNFGAGKGRVVVGAAYTLEDVDTSDARGLQTVVFEPIDSHREAVFSQVDWKFNDKFKAVVAGRVDASDLHSTQFSPKVALVYSINSKHSIRATYNEAFQVANYSEFFLQSQIASFPIGGFVRTICEGPVLPMPVDCGITGDFIPILAVGNDDLSLEETSAWEIGYSGLIADRLFMTVDYYSSDNSNFITDLVPQIGTVLGQAPCLDNLGNPTSDPLQCPTNSDYSAWVGPDEAENTFIFGPLTVAQALRNAVDNVVGSQGFRFATGLDGSPVVIGRTYSNVGEVETQGIDFGAQIFANEAWNLQLSYSWFDFKILDTDTVACDPADPTLCIEEILLPNSPAHKASLAVSFSKNRWNAGVSGRWVDDFRWSAGLFQGDVPAYTTTDVNVSYNWSELVTVGLNVANAADNLHRQTFGGDLLERRALLNVAFSW